MAATAPDATDTTGSDMNRNQRLAVVIALSNLALIGLFPPVDQFPVAATGLPAFAGFHWIFDLPPLVMVNADFLALAIIVVLVNLAIAWLLLGQSPAAAPGRSNGLRRAALLFTACNLLLMLLFPPMESVYALHPPPLTLPPLPTFEGFIFVFAAKPGHVIVESLLYLEIAIILANGALLWLVFGHRRQPTSDDIRRAIVDDTRG
jgi:hypothetical protein